MAAGEEGEDHMEHFCLSTPALLFSLTHWQINLGDEKAKNSAGDLFDDIVHCAMGRGEYVMKLEEDLPCSCFSTNGAASHVQHGSITNCSLLSAEFPLLGGALRRSQDKHVRNCM